jgi:crotonobetainyl-CoA:carnitine CoA-transferase CaiB-like acyl-CoA transferase
VDKKPRGAGPLSGVRVIDLTSMVFGPYATQIMADMGADVIKVEPPGGDATRYISVAPTPGMSGVFVNVNRGKRSIVLDLQSADGQAALRGLLEQADVFIHSMRHKAIAKLGFDYEAVAAINPSIVYTNCYGYGRKGPERDQPAYDDTIQAECGLTGVQRMLTGEANYVGTIVADKVAGLTALYATTMALFHRERTGEGQEVEVGMFETMASFMLVEHANGAMFDPPLGPACYPRVVAANRRPYRTRDGHVSALIYNDKHWSLFVDAVKPDWADEAFATLGQRARQIDRIYGPAGGHLPDAHHPGVAGPAAEARHSRRAAAHARRAAQQPAPRGGRLLRDRRDAPRQGALSWGPDVLFRDPRQGGGSRPGAGRAYAAGARRVRLEHRRTGRPIDRGATSDGRLIRQDRGGDRRQPGHRQGHRPGPRRGPAPPSTSRDGR